MASKKKSEQIKIQFIGATDQVTGSKTLLQLDGLNIFVDFGSIQNQELTTDQVYKLNRKPLPIPVEDIDYVILLHGHFDHVNSTPMLSDARFKGKILCTYLTAKIMNLICNDSAHIMQKEVTRINKNRTVNQIVPLYTKTDVEYIMNFVQGYDFNKKIKLTDRVEIEFLPAGHISGASMLSVTFQISEYEKKTVLFTSDTSGIDRNIPFTMKPNIEKHKYNMIVTEATYGDREHDDINTEKQLEDCIRETCINKKGSLIIPSFAVSRATNIVLMLKNIYGRNKEFNDIDLYLASPMSIHAHQIIGDESSFDFYDQQWYQYKDLFIWNKIELVDSFDVVKERLINDKPKVVVSASGMVENGYVKYIISKYLSNKKNKILMSGYQANGTLGRKLLDGIVKSVTIDGEQIPIRAEVDILRKMSSHASCSELINMLKSVEKKKVKKIALLHGSDNAKKNLREELKKEFDCEIIIPQENQIVKL